MYFYLGRMFIHEVAQLINRKDIRTARKWCKKHGVTVYRDFGGESVIKAEFDLAYDRQIILNLKAQHGDKWQDMYEAYQNGNLYLVMDFEQAKKSNRYTPIGNIAKHINNKAKLD